MEANDKAVSHFKAAFQANYGNGVLPWDQIIAAILALLGGCTLATPGNIKAQIQRPLVRARLMLRFLASGVPANACNRAVAATVATVAAATDEDLGSYLAAAQESE